MTPATLRTALASLGISQARLARLLDLNPSTIQRWLTGQAPIPRPVELLLALMVRGVTDADTLERWTAPR